MPENRINAGEVEITLDGEKHVLRPTLGAAQAVSRGLDGFMNAIRKLSAYDIDAITFVIQHGLGMSDRDAKDLPETVYASGIHDLVAPTIQFVNLLANGGRPIEAAKEQDRGNAQAAA